MRNRYNKGFTLIELLVVIGIVGLLLAILIPTLSKIRANARTVLCCNNLRQLNLAAVLFREDKGYYPRSYLTTADGRFDVEPEPDFFPKYLDGDREVLRCPEVEGYFNDTVPAVPVYSYGYFWFKKGGVGTGAVFTPLMEKQSSQVPMFADSADTPIVSNINSYDIMAAYWYGGVNPSNPCDFDGDGDVTTEDYFCVSDNWYEFSRRHNRCASIIYFDGHVGQYPAPPPAMPPLP